MSTDCLFRDDAYLKECGATVTGVTEAGGVILDRTVFYAASGGQPADRGVLRTAAGQAIPIASASYTDPEKTVISHLSADTGGAVGDAEGRLDFDIPEAGLDKDEITRKLADMIATGAEVRSRWITDAELEAAPGLVKTMSVKPPMGTGRVRLIEIVGYDLQPCGGTHVHRTNEIGDVRVTQIEKKGRQNRRVRIAFA